MEAAIEPENGFPLPGLGAGDAVFFDRNTYHRSLRNETDRDRYAYSAQYIAANARLALTGEKDPHLMRARDLHQQWKARL